MTGLGIYYTLVSIHFYFFMLISDVKLANQIKIGQKFVGEGQPVFFIAEIGNNHNGDYYLAKRTIEQAAKAGADAVKLQKRFIDEVFTKEMRDKPQVKDQVLGKTYGEYRQALELNEEEFRGLKSYAESLGLIFFATPFDMKSVDFLEGIGSDVYKIASFDVTNLPLLRYIASKGKPMFLSVGMSTWDEIDEAVEAIVRINNQLAIKHCVSIYPTPDDRENLSSIQELKRRYDPIPIGYSGHEHDILPSLAAVMLGAKSIERHFTLDKGLPGPDHATVSLEPDEFRKMVEETRRLEKTFGDPLRRLQEEEKKAREKHTKSITTLRAIPAGALIEENMLTCKSPGYGLKPNMIPNIIGKKTVCDLEPDVTVKLEHIQW